MFNYNSCLVFSNLVLADEYNGLPVSSIANLDGTDLDVSNDVDAFIINAVMAATQYDGEAIDLHATPCFENAEVGSRTELLETTPTMLSKEMVKAFHGIVEAVNIKDKLNSVMAIKLNEYFSMLDGDYSQHSARVKQLIA
ncbi:MAG: hypothetical protein CML20_12575 [Rheinheimera sp.]|jgi:hypothetical protein|nr:hypothetical protein [Rheinheimera sp.]